jgi:alkaline phosphatase
MQGIPGEISKFEKGKLTGEVSTTTTIDVTDLVNKEVALQREQDKSVLTARLNEIAAKKYRPQVDLIGGKELFGGGIRVNRIGADYLRASGGDEKVLLRYTIMR